MMGAVKSYAPGLWPPGDCGLKGRPSKGWVAACVVMIVALLLLQSVAAHWSLLPWLQQP